MASRMAKAQRAFEKKDISLAKKSPSKGFD